MGPHGEFYAASTSKLCAWSQSGALLGEIAPSSTGQYIFSFGLKDELLFVTELGREHTTTSFKNFKPRASTTGQDSLILRYWKSNSGFWGSPWISNSLFVEEPYTFQIFAVKTSSVDGTLKSRFTDGFMKVKPIQVSHHYNFMQVWLAERDSFQYVVQELAAEAFIYMPTSKGKERKEGTKFPTYVESIPLNLSKYTPPPEGSFSISKPVQRDIYGKMIQGWLNSWSSITYFGLYGENGFVISYSIPNCASDSLIDCSAQHLGIQRLDANFQPIGELIEIEGNMMGVNPEGKICVFQSNPIQEGEKVVGDQPKIFLFD